MKHTNNILKGLLLLPLLFVAAGCNNGFNPKYADESADNSNLAQIVLNIEDSASRTVFAPVTSADMSNIKLEYKKSDAAEEYSTVATWENTAVISSNPAYLVPDTYDLKISANASGFIYMAEKTAVTLAKGINTIDAELVLTAMDTPAGTGTFELTLTVPAGQLTNPATPSNPALVPVEYVSNNAYFSVYKNGTVLNGYVNAACTASSVNTENNTITFKAESPAGLESGMYEVVISVYTDQYKTFKVASCNDSIQIVNNLKTEKAYTRQHLSVDPDTLTISSIGEITNGTYVVKDKKMYIGGTGLLEHEEEIAIKDGNCLPFDGIDFEEVYVGDGITGIGNYFFYKTNIKIIIGCNDVTTIGENAFKDCTAIEEIDGFNSLEGTAFPDGIKINNGSKIKSIKGFNKLTEIPYEAFRGNTSLETVEGFESVTIIKSSAFLNCSKLKEIPAFNNVTKILGSAFSGCRSLTNIGKIKKTETDVEVEAFMSLTNIDYQSFDNCTSLVEINGFNKVTIIDTSSFENCKALEKIKGFASVTKIKGAAFYRCSKLTNFDFGGSEDQWKAALGYNAETDTWKNADDYASSLAYVSLSQEIIVTFNNSNTPTN